MTVSTRFRAIAKLMFRKCFGIMYVLGFFCALTLAQSRSTSDLRAQIEQISRDAHLTITYVPISVGKKFEVF